ncbi:UDP-glucuronosyltransferase 1A1 isoform X3 [Xenopus laevis]|uniref:UDP-glucuronosyltransferase n=1 Tax=Xenopus laevis TaxID=8355 RepID=A0A8J0TWF1_XENLA|nr:UDP-glucuronosyltransferase 1A1 isoform X3 [Xenopus laevis]
MPPSILLLIIFGVVCLLEFPGLTEGGKLLVIPQDTDVWLDMHSMVTKLKKNGHEIVVVMPKNNEISHLSKDFIMKTYPVPALDPELQINLEPTEPLSLLSCFFSTISIEYRRLRYTTSILSNTCQHLLDDQELVRYLERSSFDAVVIDPWFPCGPILAEHLSLPSIYVMPGFPCGWDYTATRCPKSPYQSQHYGQMDFTQRMKNLLVESLEYIACQEIKAEYTRMASQFLHKHVNILQVLSQAELWLFRYDFVVESAKPVMPNMMFIGGETCKEKENLPHEFEKLVNSSGEHGFVVFSLGSMVSEIPINKATDIAEALKSIPQQVLWRYTGKTPPNLGENTHLVKWLPQNDLLAHPKARAFITHAGSHGIYEGICNAVPMVMLPLFGDQMDNAKRIESRGAGLTLNVLHMTSEDLSNAVKAVINNPVYKENIQRLSSLHLDRPVHPLDLAVHWVEFVMRHKGAPHLRPAAHDLNWFQYYSLDVIGFLMFFLLTTLFISLKCCTFVFRRCCKRSSKQKPKSKSQ